MKVTRTVKDGTIGFTRKEQNKMSNILTKENVLKAFGIKEKSVKCWDDFDISEWNCDFCSHRKDHTVCVQLEFAHGELTTFICEDCLKERLESKMFYSKEVMEEVKGYAYCGVDIIESRGDIASEEYQVKAEGYCGESLVVSFAKGRLSSAMINRGCWSQSDFDNLLAQLREKFPKEEPVVKEVTMADLEKKYGCKVKVVKDED